MLMTFVLIIAGFFACFFYYQATITGLGRKRWALLGLLFGPFVLPFFRFKKELEIIKIYGRHYSVWKA